MGNFFGSSSSSSSTVEQPKLFGKLPNPYPISKINPVLLVYPTSGQDYVVTIDSSYTPSDAVDLLLAKNCLDRCERFVMIAHGFQSDKNTAWLHELKDTILQCDNRLKQTVAILGWEGGADIGLLRYSQAAANALETGRWLGEFLTAFREKLPKIATYGVGHSLGSHLMGVAGRTSKALDRITGLDPAGPGFQDDNVDKRLNRLDAKLVDVMHTDGMAVPYFGTLVPLGLLDFYPNYGWNQPTKDRSRSAKPDIDYEDEKHVHKQVHASPYGGSISESHGRAIDYFLYSVKNIRAFRTNLRLDGEPDVESAVHRIIATGTRGHEFQVEMGYYCDLFMNELIAKQNNQTAGGGRPPVVGTDDGGGAECSQQVIGNREDEYTKYDPFAGYYYIHTNGTAPWS